jgi:hypothetical protein
MDKIRGQGNKENDQRENGERDDGDAGDDNNDDDVGNSVDSDDEEDEESSSAHDPAKMAFEKIVKEVNEDGLKWENKAERKRFLDNYKQHLETKTKDKKTLLHMLAHEGITNKGTANNSLKLLVKYLIKKYPDLMLATDESGETPLYIAISKKKSRLVGWMYENCQ